MIISFTFHSLLIPGLAHFHKKKNLSVIPLPLPHLAGYRADPSVVQLTKLSTVMGIGLQI